MTAPTTKKLPITLLCGFLGAGKTTLLKHILQTKHDTAKSDDGSSSFKCAVIVNDMAEINIDEALIDQSNLVQSDEKIVSMKNGCVCCDLKSDLMQQIIDLAQTGKFEYMIIEASGVSEPAEIAQLFQDCDDEDHNHGEGEDENHVSLNDVARLDTCVTLVDCLDFFQNVGKMGLANRGQTSFNRSNLLVEQIECTNVVLLNKTDLVSPTQLARIKQHVRALNSTAVLLTSSIKKPLEDIMAVVDTNLFEASNHLEHWKTTSLTQSFQKQSLAEQRTQKSCCLTSEAAGKPACCEPTKSSCCSTSEAEGKPPCCGSKTKSNSELSTIIVGRTVESGPESESKKAKLGTRHETRFAISSFLYSARFPFHPTRFNKEFVEKYFVVVHEEEDDEEEDDEEETEEKKELEEDLEDLEERMEELQVEAAAKQNIRQKAFGGQLIRSKGFLWLANLHDLKVVYSQAGSMVTVDDGSIWNVLTKPYWVGTDAEKAKLKADAKGIYGDRRQELVFIGIDLDAIKIQKVLDGCLMTKGEYEMGVDGWKATFY